MDLVTWVREAGLATADVDWGSIDRSHDEYLAQVLPERIAARDRIRQLHRPVDEKQEVTPHRRWTIAKASAATAREFERSLGTYDERFLRGIASTRGLSRDLAEYLVVRRALDRLSQRFALAQPKTPIVSSLPRPVEWTLESWPAGSKRDADAITTWTLAAGQRLAPQGDRLWDEVLRGSLMQLEPPPPPAEGAEAKSPEDEQMERFAAAALEAAGPAQAFLRASLDVIDPLTCAEASAIPDVARERATDKVLGATSLPDAMRTMSGKYAAALALPGLSAEARRGVEEERAKWRKDLLALMREDSPKVPLGLEAARRALARLLALLPDPAARSAIEAPPTTRQAEVGAVDDDTEAAIPESARHYANWTGVALVPRPPSRHELREVARLAGLDPAQARIFVDDSLLEWTRLMEAQSEVVRETERAIGDAGEGALERPTVFSALLARVVSDCIERPASTGAAVDAHIADSLRLRAEALGGPAEPALSIWRALRALPEPSRAWAQAGHSELRCFGAPALGSAAALALDPELPPSTRRVLADLVVEHVGALVEEAATVRSAQANAVRTMARILLQEHRDERRLKSLAAPVIAQVLGSTASYTQLNDAVIDKACALLPTDDAIALRHRRATRQYPELLTEGSTPFARDGTRARSLAAQAGAAGDGTVNRSLQRDDLALVEAVVADLALVQGAQPTRAELTRLWGEREALAERSLRRIDRAARAARDAATAHP